MNSKTTTSIITLTKNRAELLEKNLISLTKQSIRPNEIIIIDNNSTDQTPEFINKYLKILPIKAFKSFASGYSKLYNLGIQKASGKLLCFLDDDCLADKNWLKNLVEKSHQYPNSIIQGNTFSLPKNNLYAEIMGNHYQNYLKSNVIIGEKLRFLDNKNLAVPKKIIKKYGGFSQKQNLGSEDIEFGLRMRRNGVKIIFQPKAIAWHHERDNFKDFIKQHYRIAKSESILDKNLIENKDKVGLFPKKKTLMNLQSALKSEIKYLKRGRFADALKLPFIYFLLLFLRIIGYLKQK
jgi:GT2 family glycosyltransferase